MTDYTLHCGDCLDVMQTMADNSVDLIATDPPYHRVRMNEAWDRVHKTDKDYLAWLDTVLAQFARILKPNGSLYMFASPRMAARVEVLIGERFNALNHIVWDKGRLSRMAGKDERLRQYVPMSERIIFAEHYGADNIAKGGAGYAAKCDELRGFVFEPLRAYLDEERKRAGVSKSQVNKLFDGPNVGQYWWQQRNWQLPIKEHYETLRVGLSRLNHGGQYLQRPYEELRTEYEELRTEYEELRTEYEELRRPFTVTQSEQHVDIWSFDAPPSRADRHSCQKPVAMMDHIITASSKVGATVFDPFMGSGSTGVAAIKHGRKFIGCDLSERWVNRTRQRIEAETLTVQPTLLEVA